MPVEVLESFAWTTDTAHLTRKLTTASGTMSLISGRFGGSGALRLSSTLATFSWTISSKQERVVGFAFRADTLDANRILEFREGVRFMAVSP